jgi:hypothetical protein
MRTTRCEYEQAVLRAVAGGTLPEDLRAHLAGCTSCANAAVVAQALRAAAEVTSHEPLPDPGRIWRAAQRRERMAAAQRALWPIRVMTRVAIAAVVVAAAAGLVWLWPVITEQGVEMARGFMRPAAGEEGQAMTAILALASFATFSAAFGVFESWARD